MHFCFVISICVFLCSGLLLAAPCCHAMDLKAHLQEAELLYLENPKKALDMLVEASNKFDSDASYTAMDTAFYLGMELSKLDGRLDDAMMFLSYAAERVPDSPNFQFHYGLALSRKNDYLRSLQPMLHAVGMKPGQPEYEIEIAKTYLALKNPSLARWHVLAALEHDPTSKAAFSVLSEIDRAENTEDMCSLKPVLPNYKSSEDQSIFVVLSMSCPTEMLDHLESNLKYWSESVDAYVIVGVKSQDEKRIEEIAKKSLPNINGEVLIIPADHVGSPHELSAEYIRAKPSLKATTHVLFGDARYRPSNAPLLKAELNADSQVFSITLAQDDRARPAVSIIRVDVPFHFRHVVDSEQVIELQTIEEGSIQPTSFIVDFAPVDAHAPLDYISDQKNKPRSAILYSIMPSTTAQAKSMVEKLEVNLPLLWTNFNRVRGHHVYVVHNDMIDNNKRARIAVASNNPISFVNVPIIRRNCTKHCADMAEAEFWLREIANLNEFESIDWVMRLTENQYIIQPLPYDPIYLAVNEKASFASMGDSADHFGCDLLSSQKQLLKNTELPLGWSLVGPWVADVSILRSPRLQQLSNKVLLNNVAFDGRRNDGCAAGSLLFSAAVMLDMTKSLLNLGDLTPSILETDDIDFVKMIIDRMKQGDDSGWNLQVSSSRFIRPRKGRHVFPKPTTTIH